MVYVPTPAQPPESPRVRELSRRIEDLIREYQRQFPMTPTEIRQALRHAEGRSAGGSRPTLAVVAGLIAAVVGAGVFASRAAGGGGEAAFPVVALVAALGIGLGLAVLIKRSR